MLALYQLLPKKSRGAHLSILLLNAAIKLQRPSSFIPFESYLFVQQDSNSETLVLDTNTLISTLIGNVLASNSTGSEF